jgi:hypothetical protein
MTGEKRLFEVHVNWINKYKNEYSIKSIIECNKVQTIRNRDIFYYIQLKPIKIHKSLFNERLYIDYDVELVAGLHLIKEKWQIEFLKLPRGRGEDEIRFSVKDPFKNETILNVPANSSYTNLLARKIANCVHIYHQLSRKSTIFDSFSREN